MKRKSTIIGYELADQVAERLADKGDPDIADFGLGSMGIAIDHLSDTEIDNLIRTAFAILEGRRTAGTLTFRQKRLLSALSDTTAMRDSEWSN